ncbi:MAG TPA: ACS family MFS transporter [Candidatus Binataceae bacterium]|nr:ACS family MFS transporter [Candidatus Binataceae bacterium]
MPNSSLPFDAALAGAEARAWPRRYTVVLLFALATALCYIDRVNISIAIIPLARAKGYDAGAKGLVLSAFFWGYLWLQMPGGWVADRFGGKKVLMAGVALWSLATFFTPVAVSLSFGILLVMRVLLGAGEAVNFPAVHSIAARWTIAAERARAISLHFSGVAFGTIVALLLSPALVIWLGWPSVFYISGSLGLIWLLLWHWKAADGPEDCPGVTAHEMDVIRDGRDDAPLADSIPWKLILHEPAVWAIVIAHLCNNFGFYIILLWLPSYLTRTFNVPMARLGFFSVVPWIVAFIMQNSSGWVADNLNQRGLTLTTVRKLLQTSAFTLGAIPLLVLPHAHSPITAVALVTLSIAGTALGAGGFAVNHLDVAPRYAGILMGLSNTFATLPGIIGVAATGFIVETTGSFAAAFYLTVAIYLVGGICYLLLGSGERKI